MFRAILSLFPPGVIRWLGSLQYRLPVVGPTLGWLGRRLVAGEGRIRHGLGAGLRFDATGSNPGFILGTTEPIEQDALAKYLVPGGCFYDIGANYGFFCVLAARVVGTTGRVYAFEPHPDFAARLQKNADLNQFEQIEVFQAAVANSAGRMKFLLEGVVCPRLGSATTVAGTKEIEVDVVRIDDLIAERSLRPPNYVKIDAEGAELLVLEGMRDTIRTHRPVILCEVHWIGTAFEDYINRELRPLGYTMTNLEADEPIPTGMARYHAVLSPTPSEPV